MKLIRPEYTGFKPGLGPQVASGLCQLCCFPHVGFLLRQWPLMNWADGHLQFHIHILTAQQLQWKKKIDFLPQQFQQKSQV